MTIADGQTIASRPAVSAWVGASAGTGKTKVLADRVLRLLLAGTKPEKILSLTFTRAAAAEMSNRIFDALAAWSAMDEDKLTQTLADLTEAPPDEDMLARARALFLEVLDTPSGMKIQTIHAFCESVLGRFPLEAEISPQFEVMDERTAGETLRHARDRTIAEAEAKPCSALARAFATVTGRIAEDTFDKLMSGLAQERDKLSAVLAASHPDVEAAAFRWFGLEPGETEAVIIQAACVDDAFDGEGLRAAAEALSQGSKTDAARGEAIAEFLSDAGNRAALFTDYMAQFLTKTNGTPRKPLATKAVVEKAPAALEALAIEAERLEALRERMLAAHIAEASGALALLAGALLDAYGAEKAWSGRLDYDDLIRGVRGLLSGEGAAQWVLYKLDGGIDHVLIDEAQDTSPAQWSVVRALVEEFFAGESAREGERTLFAVGDPKQSIYSFQGADPDAFQSMRDHFRGRIAAARKDWESVALEVSFRTTEAVLTAVDAVFARDDARRGLGAATIHHAVHRTGQAGRVELWPAAAPIRDEGLDPWLPLRSALEHESGEQRLSRALANRIETWIRDGERLETRDRPISAGDIMVLVRRRTAFVELLVNDLKRRNIGVAGVDRLVLSNQLAVMDLLALGEVALMIEDDLSLATALKGPLFGFDEEKLFRLAYGRGKGETLFAALRGKAATDPHYARADALIDEILAMADFVPPFEFFTRILTTMGGRERIVSHLGLEAEDPIDEFLALALDYEREHAPSLQGFVSWFGAAATEVKRDLEHGARDEVRVMTVHGAKGLQAPVVILADTMQKPERGSSVLWAGEDEAVDAMIWRPAKPLQDARTRALDRRDADRREEEYHRLLYVAMTRAEDRLYVAGYETQKEAPADCWYHLIKSALEPIAAPVEMTIEVGEGEDITPVSGIGLVLAVEQTALPDRTRTVHEIADADMPLPPWARAPAAPEYPPRPALSPSRLDEDDSPIRSPGGADRGAGLRRGRIIHDLLQRVGELDQVTDDAISSWLARPVLGLDPEARAEIAGEVETLLASPDLAPLFGPAAMAEVPIAGRIGEDVYSGRIDRLVVTDTEVHLADFKTDRDPPADENAVPTAYLRQMAAYRALLARIYPDRPIRCSLIWTVGPRVMTVDPPPLDA